VKDVTTSVSTTGNIDTSNAVAMTIHAGAIGKLMSMFSNQYSNAALAVVREYFCNGDDARIAAGSDRPTEVFLPTELNPVLLVRDYGVGLDKNGLVSTFATYGLSTKDQSNDETGGFGIGSKAAFTIGTQFVVTGYKDGVKTVVRFFLDDSGVGQVDVRWEGETDEPNGVLVEVGVPDVRAMTRAANQFFLTVPKGRALVDGQAPTHLYDTVEHVRFTDESVLVKDEEGEIRLQMGPVVYPVRDEILSLVAARLEGLPSQAVAQAMSNWDSTDSLLLEVGMGEVQIAPSREDLRDTEATVNRLAAVVQGISDHIHNDIQQRIDNAGSRFQATLVLRQSLEDLSGFKVRKGSFTYQGQEKAFKGEVKVPFPVFYLTKRSWRSNAMVVGRDDAHVVDFQRADQTLVVTGVGLHEVSKVSRYAKRFLETRTDVSYIVVTDQAEGAVEWFEWGHVNGALSMTLDRYRAALRAMRDSSPVLRSEPSYTTGWNTTASRDLDDRDLLTDIVSWGKPLVIFHDSSPVRDAKAREILDEKYTPIVLLAQQSENALRKRVEADGTVEIFEGDWRAEVREVIKAEVPPPTDDERLALGAANWLRQQRGYYGRSNNWAKTLVNATGGFPTPLRHPAIQEALDLEELAELLAADLSDERKEALQRLQAWTGTEFSAIEFEGSLSNISHTFPLFRNGLDYSDMKRDAAYRKAVVDYINSLA
jgi:hypothetical protein